MGVFEGYNPRLYHRLRREVLAADNLDHLFGGDILGVHDFLFHLEAGTQGGHAIYYTYIMSCLNKLPTTRRELEKLSLRQIRENAEVLAEAKRLGISDLVREAFANEVLKIIH